MQVNSDWCQVGLIQVNLGQLGEPWMFYPQTISSQVVSLDPQEFPPGRNVTPPLVVLPPGVFFSSQAQTSMLSYRG